MDRLTNIGTKGELYITDNDETRHIGQKEAAYAKLKEYEDIEEAGLLVRLPCKAGNTVYVVAKGDEFRPDSVDEVIINQFKTRAEETIAEVYVGYGRYTELDLDEIYLTKEEAEQSLKEARKG